jgi:hypothetical protein
MEGGGGKMLAIGRNLKVLNRLHAAESWNRKAYDTQLGETHLL